MNIETNIKKNPQCIFCVPYIDSYAEKKNESIQKRMEAVCRDVYEFYCLSM